MTKIADLNVFGKPLTIAGTSPMTGFFRNGYCCTGTHDVGSHVVAAVVTDAFLNYSKQQGNDLITPNPAHNFPGLKAGDIWCLCSMRWKEALADATLEYAATLYDDLLGSALLVPEGQPPEARSGTSALRSRSGTLEAQPDPTFFDLVSQVLLRESTDRSLMIVQARGFSSRTAEALPYDALVAFSVMPANDRLTELGEELRDAVAANSARAGVLQGEPETAGLEVGVSRQARYLDAVHGGEFAVVWLSPTLQTAYRTGVDPSQAALFASLNITTVDSSPLRFLEQRIWSAESISPDLVETVLAYQSRRDVVALQHLQQTWVLKRINDSALGLSFLAILDDAGAVLALLNLAPRDPESRIELDLANTGLSEAVGKFVSTRAGWLILGPMP